MMSILDLPAPVQGQRHCVGFRVHGLPKGQPRPRAFARRMGNKFVARVFDAGTAEGWKGNVAMAAQPHKPATPIEGPVCLSIIFYLPRPDRLCRKKDPREAVPATCKPDADNAAKAVMDALTVLGFWEDDAQVMRLMVVKLYHAIGESPGAAISIEWGAFVYETKEGELS